MKQFEKLSRCLVAFFAMTMMPHSVCAELRAGAARVEIRSMPDSELLAPTGKFQHEHLYTRAIFIDDGSQCAVLVTSDQIRMSEGVWREASKRIVSEDGCSANNLIIAVTHTHSPASSSLGSPSGILDVVEQRFVDSITDAARQAKKHLEPARMVFGTGAAYLNVNRDQIQPLTRKWTQGPNQLAPSDKTVSVLALESPSGKPIGIFVTYAMHAVNGYLSNFASADFPGAMCRYLENNFGNDTVAMFAQNASGDQNPLYMHLSTDAIASRLSMPINGLEQVREPIEAPLRMATDKGASGSVKDVPTLQTVQMAPEVRIRLEQWMETEGMLLGEEVIRVLSNASTEVPNVHIWGEEQQISCPGRVRLDQGREAMQGVYGDALPISMRLGVVGFGNMVLPHINAEVYTQIGLDLKSQSPLTNTMLVTIANGRANTGYIPDDASFQHQTFQVLASRLKPGCAEKLIPQTLVQMIQKHLANQ